MYHYTYSHEKLQEYKAYEGIGEKNLQPINFFSLFFGKKSK
jgi:hypothetical protein